MCVGSFCYSEMILMKKTKFDFEFCMKQRECRSCKNRRHCDESEEIRNSISKENKKRARKKRGDTKYGRK